MKQQIQQLFAEILKNMEIEGAGIAVEISENSVHGDYTTNVAMLLAGRLKTSPIKIAQKIVDAIIKHQKESASSELAWLEKAEAAPPGFINLWLSTVYFGSQIEKVLEEKDCYGSSPNPQDSGVGFQIQDQKSEKKIRVRQKAPNSSMGKDKAVSKTQQEIQTPSENAEKKEKIDDSASFGKKIMVEFAHPNTHKAFHIGHLRNITTGESIIRLLESQGNRVIRVNYQGDVGMHIAKALYSLLEVSPYKEDVKVIKGIKERVEFLGKAYAAGSKAFEEDEKAKAIIVDLNALIYASAQRYAKEVGRDPGTTDYLALVKNHVHPMETVYALWKETRQWSLDYFETVYQRVGSHYDRLYFESECLAGVDMAKDAVTKGTLKKSDGAIIFDGKPYDIDTRVFVNSLGLPTYEGKELALSRMETTEFGEIDRIIHVVGPEQASFFKVSFKAEELLGFVQPGVQYHLIYGWVKLKQEKMSSRTGNVVLGEWLLDEAKKSIYTIVDKSTSEAIAEVCAVAAVKYAFLKVGTNQEIAFDLKESISFDGDSGPYLLYSYARCKSVLRKAQNQIDQVRFMSLNIEERDVVRRVAQFPEVVADAGRHFAPNTLCTYLFDLAQEFNVLYAKHSILGESHRLALTAAVAQVLKNGLYLLGIPVVERM